MGKDTGLSCPLCLNVDDPEGMLAVAIPHSRFPQPVPARFCTRCVLEVMKAAFSSELIDPVEVLASVTSETPAPTRSIVNASCSSGRCSCGT